MMNSRDGRKFQYNGIIDKSELTEIKETSEPKKETVEELKNQLTTLTNSLATLSAEKSRMEAHFQNDRRQLRTEREECEKIIKNLTDKLKRAQQCANSEIEHIKYKLIMERHDREKEQIDNSAMIKELQKLVANERRAKESLECQLKELKKQSNNKTTSKVLEAELEIVNNKLREAEAAVNETPPMLLSLQAEIVALKKHHKNLIYEERKRAIAAEQQAKALEMVHEARVVGLETRLAELSDIVGGYERLRQTDQNAIQKLKDQLSELQLHQDNECLDLHFNQDPNKIALKIRELYNRLLNMSNHNNTLVNMKEFLKSLNLCNINDENGSEQKYELLKQEFDQYKEEVVIKLKRSENRYQLEKTKEEKNTNELNLIKIKNLEERIQTLNKEACYKENELEKKVEKQLKLFQEEQIKFDVILSEKESNFRNKLADLEHQLLRQRERSLAVLEEKDQEIRTLKSSIRAILMKKDNPRFNFDKSSAESKTSSETMTDFVTAMLTVDSSPPPLLHYAQELARREIQVTGLRRQNTELENTLRENQQNLLIITQHHSDEIEILEAKISRLDACKLREGANLEYLKNVFVNYLTSTDPSSKRHMLNAIATVLQFNVEEMDKIQKIK